MVALPKEKRNPLLTVTSDVQGRRTKGPRKLREL